VTEPLHVIRPAGNRLLPDFEELWAFRDLCVALGRRDVTLRYRQTILGVVWVILQPLIAGSVFTVVFGKVAGLRSGIPSYFLFAYSGFIAWSAFSNAMTRAAGSVIGQSNLVTKVFFPRLVLPISALFSSFVDFLVGAASLLVVFAFTGVSIQPGLLTLPFWLLLLFAQGLGIGTIAAAISVRYRDVQHALPVLTQLLLYASPVAYATTAVPESIRRWFVLNPLAGALDGFRWAFVGTDAPSALSVATAIAGAILALVAGAMTFARFERQLADVI
jgi:lipopolysaccharide transport system permease protein